MFGIHLTLWQMMKMVTMARLILVLVTSLLVAVLLSLPSLRARILNMYIVEILDRGELPAVDLDIESQEKEKRTDSIDDEIAVGEVVLTTGL